MKFASAKNQKIIMEKIKIFATSFTQVALVSVNTILITKGYVLGIFMVAFTISFIWCYNVSKIALSDIRRKLIYSFGAGLGSVTGYLVMKILA